MYLNVRKTAVSRDRRGSMYKRYYSVVVIMRKGVVVVQGAGRSQVAGRQHVTGAKLKSKVPLLDRV